MVLGIGYLSHLLHDKYKYSVLGIECSAEYINLAYKNQKKFYPNSEGHVNFIEHYIDGNSHDQIKLLTQKYFQKNSRKYLYSWPACLRRSKHNNSGFIC
ncbi:hypothetical protein NQ314_003607 [Rhamnusium bicolor]|uniref:Uncharacterized protein n=1 Tax=Rhamnusium bicolor TaxID=1586634 RepID=A0AAV8ZPE5_9CUCU|nr:hypothetical protein NQ314_003607 [Rhamnusium bicolor]